jgi:glycosyltransferase involved in cell wall biosynthesis/GT2 family glycosyltransferase
MRISIIIAIYKDIEALKLIIASLESQNYPDLEVIVAEDNDSPEVSEYIKTITGIDIKHTSQEDLGIRKARSQNNAILKSTGEYLIFIDGDCIPYSNFLRTHASLAEKGRVLTGRRVNLGPETSRLIRKGSLKSFDLEKNYLFRIPALLKDEATHVTQGVYIPSNSWFFKNIISKRRKKNPNILGCNFSCFREDIIKINGFDESYGETSVPDDTDIQWRFEASGLETKSCKLSANLFHLYHTPREMETNLVQMQEKMLLRKENSQYYTKTGLTTHDEFTEYIAKEIPLKKGPTAVISFGTVLGGMEMNALKLVKLLHDRLDVVLITRANTPLASHGKAECEKLGINVESISFNTFFSMSLILGARGILKKRNIKNVIFFGASEMRSLYFSFIGLDINLIIRHGTMKTTSKKDPLHRLVYSRVNHHVAVCNNLSKNVKEIIPFGKETKQKVIYSALRHIPTITSRPTRPNQAPIRLLHVARIAPGKGHIDAIQACKILYDNNIPFELHLAGEIQEPFFTTLNNIINDTGYKNSIIFHGFCNDVPAILEKSDIFIFPSSGEGLSNSFMEALAFGLVCVAYNNTSFPELRDLGFNMYLAKNNDVEDLTIKLMDAANKVLTSPLPIEKNMKLAKDIFLPQTRELDDYIEILV